MMDTNFNTPKRTLPSPRLKLEDIKNNSHGKKLLKRAKLSLAKKHKIPEMCVSSRTPSLNKPAGCTENSLTETASSEPKSLFQKIPEILCSGLKTEVLHKSADFIKGNLAKSVHKERLCVTDGACSVLKDSKLQEISKPASTSSEVLITTSDNSIPFLNCLEQPLDKKDASADNGIIDREEILARQLAHSLQDQLPANEKYYFCQICQKDLSHMNSVRRAQHVNRCIDLETEGARLIEDAVKELEKSKTAVLDCPMCGKPLKTEAARRVHLKQCALQLQVPTERLLALMAEQEEKRKIQVEAGILPAVTSTKRKRSSSCGSSMEKSHGNKAKKLVDEDTQLAMALSSSLAEEESKWQKLVGPAGPGTDGAGPSKDEIRGKRQKTKAANSLLLQISNEVSQQRIANRVMQMLDSQVLQTAAFPSLQSTRLHDQCQGLAVISGTNGLWRRSALVEIATHQETKEQFYVAALMPPVKVCWVAPGSKLKPLSAIPGRRRSSEDCSEKEGPAEICEPFSSMTEKDRCPTSSPLYLPLAVEAAAADEFPSSTQAVLAELAADGEITTSHQYDKNETGQSVVSLEESFDKETTLLEDNCSNPPGKNNLALQSDALLCVKHLSQENSLPTTGITKNQGDSWTANFVFDDKVSDERSRFVKHLIDKECQTEFHSTMPTEGTTRSPSSADHPQFFHSSSVPDKIGSPDAFLWGLQESLLGMVGSQMCADVTLYVCSQVKIPAHKVLLAARCPALLTLISNSAAGEVIKLEDIDEAVMKSMLNYIYAGIVRPLTCNVDELVQLARRLQLLQFADALRNMSSLPNSSPGRNFHRNTMDWDRDVLGINQRLERLTDIMRNDCNTLEKSTAPSIKERQGVFSSLQLQMTNSEPHTSLPCAGHIAKASECCPERDLWDGFEEMEAACNTEDPFLDASYCGSPSSFTRDSDDSLPDILLKQEAKERLNLSAKSLSSEAADVIKTDREESQVSTFKTPISKSLRMKRSPTIPSPFTPMPDYSTMPTPELKKAVENIGVKPLKKKKMILLLKDIYEKTHQYETDPEYEPDHDADGQKADDEDNDDLVPSSQESERSEVAEESFLDDAEFSSSQEVSNPELHKRISDFLQSNPDIHSNIVTYEPLELVSLKQKMMEAGIRCSMEKVIQFLDEKCITFTMKHLNKRSAKNRIRKKYSPKKKKTTK